MINNFEDFLKNDNDFDFEKINYQTFKKDKYTVDQLKIIIGRYKRKVSKLEKENQELKEKLNGKQLNFGI